MSQRAMALGVRDFLRLKLGCDRYVIDVRPPPGKPPAVAGEEFISIWEGGYDNNTTESRSDYHRINVTVTRRITYAPEDRVSEDVIDKAVIGLDLVAGDIAALIHSGDQNAYWILNKANEYIRSVSGSDTVYGFTEPLRFLSATRAEEKHGDWFHGDPSHRGVGRAITLYFGRALRLQSNVLQA